MPGNGYFLCMAPLKLSPRLEPCEPLWKRVPARDENGRPLSDFMMLIPKMRSWPQGRIDRALEAFTGVLADYRHAVVFADLNLRLNILWVTVRPIPGIGLEIAAALKLRVPEALLVANKAEAILAERR